MFGLRGVLEGAGENVEDRAAQDMERQEGWQVHYAVQLIREQGRQRFLRAFLKGS